MIIHIIIIKKQRMMNNFAIFVIIILISSAVYGADIDTDDDRRARAAAHAAAAPLNLAPISQADAIDILSADMDDFDKPCVIKAVSNVAPANYSKLIETVIALSVGMNGYNKTWIIKAVGNLAHERLTGDFIKTVNALSVGMDGVGKARVIAAVNSVVSLNYDRFIELVTILSVGVDGGRKSNVIVGLSVIPPALYPFLQQYIAALPNFFRLVPAHVFRDAIDPIQGNITEANLRIVLDYLHDQYYHNAGVGVGPGVAFDVHASAGFLVTTAAADNASAGAAGAAAPTAPFNEAVMAVVNKRLASSKIMTMSGVVALLKKLTTNPQAIDSLQWCLECVAGDKADILTLRQVVTYLISLDPDESKLRTWLDAFLEESTHAYKGRDNSNSCTKGVRERVVTSLRSALYEYAELEDPELFTLFKQLEAHKMADLIKMSWGFSDIDNAKNLADKLKAQGITKDSPIADVLEKFKIVAANQFKQHGIEITPDLQESIDGTAASLKNDDGFEDYIKPYLLKKEKRRKAR
jgi:hypothetical protein